LPSFPRSGKPAILVGVLVMKTTDPRLRGEMTND